MADPDARAARALVDVSADGLAVLDAHGRFTFVNDAAAHVLGLPAATLAGTPGPFPLTPADDGATVAWAPPGGRVRDLQYRIAPGTGGHVVWFRDVTDALHQQERLTAIARVAAGVTESASLPQTLDAVAREIVATATIAAVQILAIDDPAEDLRILGMAGFGSAPDFVERFAECRRLGADVRFLDAFGAGHRVVVAHRKAAIMADPLWAPLREIMDRPDWDGFVATPMTVRGRTLGVVNAYYVPGAEPGPLSFLEAMADHAAIAVDTAGLLAQTRTRARSDERRRLSRDLHDSVVQQLFSMRMQARVLRNQLDRDADDVDPGRLRLAAEELASLSSTALADLRQLVFELRPLELEERGLVEAIRGQAAGVQARTGLTVDVHADRDRVEGVLDLQEDVYRIVSEAVHNVVKHAGAATAEIGIAVDDGDLVVEVADDGAGTGPGGSGGLGLVSMRERTERWGGRFAAGPRPGGGWTVRVAVPLPGHVEARR
ncbi:GAF domain-containing sensor histidine kinase [Pseudonocardia sp. N23]|uniref:PAS domain-containing sensor histidine kinase n=1 Tax=Pseudonocardia sp. N23 TaxID=1987376 RepID=UPI000C02F770|nr:GAF domain-containing sensor histidine kinase [Pseudonocardia sp. N23]GAY07975.1 putative two component sensor kinase [Pseudonocardia sp. N23]